MKTSNEIGNEVVLRPRFKIELNTSNEKVLSAFEDCIEHTHQFVIKRIDDHVFISIPKEKQHFWSPQLDLEIISTEKDTATLHGLFGPKPVVWTLFMFAHFVVGTLFLAMAVWTYSNIALERPYAIQVTILGILVLTWFVLYFAGRMGKTAGKQEMIALRQFMYEVLEN